MTRYSDSEIDGMFASGLVAQRVLDAAEAVARAGVQTTAVDHEVRRVIAEAGGEPAFIGMRDGQRPAYSAACTVSVNDEILNTPPGHRTLVDGDLVTVDVGVRLGGFCADLARTLAIGSVSDDRRALLSVAREIRDAGVSLIRPGVSWTRVAAAMRALAADRGVTLIRGWAGHGIGRAVHEGPALSLWPTEDFVFEVGTVCTVEPIVALGGSEVVELADTWGARTADGSVAAYFESMVFVGRDQIRVLNG